MMHTENNIKETIFGTLFGIEGKSKDNPKARVDQETLCHRVVTKHVTIERKAELVEAKGPVQSWKASYEGNYLVGQNALDVPRWVCSESK